MSELLLDIKDLSIIYSTEDGVVRALNKANLQLPEKPHWHGES